jgi:uncharacterized protein (TIGR03000 family)
VQPASAAYATIDVQLPASADLFVEGRQLSQTSATRRVVTPNLEAGQTYAYTLKAKMVRDGQTVTATKTISFRAGETARVDFGALETAVAEKPAAAPARITVRLPADAKLSIDGVACPLTSGTRSFDTPDLQPGKSYAYTLKAEIVRDGKARAESRKVMVQAGEKLTVRFRDQADLQTAQR